MLVDVGKLKELPRKKCIKLKGTKKDEVGGRRGTKNTEMRRSL